MLKITNRILIILLISVMIGFGVFKIVNHVIDTTSGSSFESWSEVFKWLRHFSSLGLIGVIAHALPFVLITVVVIGIERSFIRSKK